MENNKYRDIKFIVEQIAKKEKEKKDSAFVRFILSDVLGLEEGVCEEAMLVGGPKDCGIDAFWEEGETIHILQAKYYKPKNKISQKDVENLFNTISYLKDNDSDKGRRYNKTIREKALDYKDAIQRGLSTHLLFVTSSTLSPAARHELKRIQKEILRSQDNIKYEVWEIDDIYSEYSANKKLEAPDIELSIKNKDYFESSGIGADGTSFVVLNIAASDLFDAYHKYKGAIFMKNLRFFMGKGGKVNKGIVETLKDDKERESFWYYNNGLTILCDDYEINSKNNSISVKNMQIVNGAQTTRSIYEAFSDLSIEKGNGVYVLARIIKTSAEGGLLTDHIRDYNNRQNPTKARDFVSSDPIQLQLQAQFRGLKYYYEIKRGERSEPFIEKQIKKDKLEVIDNLTVAQAHYSFSGHPAEAKSQKAALLDPQGGYYKDIFQKRSSAQELLFSYLCYEEAKNRFRTYKKKNKNRKKEDEYILHGTNHIVAIMGVISREIFNLGDELYDPERFEIITSTKVIGRIYECAEGLLCDYYAQLLTVFESKDEFLAPSAWFKSAGNADALLKTIGKQVVKYEKRIKQEILSDE